MPTQLPLSNFEHTPQMNARSYSLYNHYSKRLIDTEAQLTQHDNVEYYYMYQLRFSKYLHIFHTIEMYMVT